LGLTLFFHSVKVRTMSSKSGPLFVPNHVKQQVTHERESQFWDESFQPAHDFLLLERIYEYKGELHIPDSVIDKSQVTVVHAVGKGGRMPDGSWNVPQFTVGQRVFIKSSAGIKFNQKDSKRHFILVHDSDILGFFPEKKVEPSTETINS
jgi:co-chaperonin GroES (HSP10)